MRRVFATLTAAAIGLLLVSLSGLTPAQEKGDKKKDGEYPAAKPGKEHEVLKSLAGTFDAKVKMFSFTDPKAAPTESTGVMKRKMVLNGNFLQENFKGKFMDQEFAGMGMIGYDPAKKKYFTTWYDSMSLNMSIMHGSYNADKKTFTTVGEDEIGGKKMKARDVLKIVSDDEQFFTMYRQAEGSPEFKVMEITYMRKKVEKKANKG